MTMLSRPTTTPRAGTGFVPSPVEEKTPMATLTTQVINLAGLAPTYGAAAASTKIVCGERTFLHVKNTAGSSMTVTDRKSTRLNSSHSQISYAVFCLKKKKK